MQNSMEDVPLLPGHRTTDVTRTNFLVPRTLSFKNGHRIVSLPRFGIGQIEKPKIYLTEEEQEVLNNFKPELIYGQVRAKESHKFVPNIVFYDKKVLRFYGYFKQTIYESPIENYRVRRVNIYYYLEDDTIAIYEIPCKNSSLVQGMRVRRHRISKNDQHEFYNWRDFNLGLNLAVYGTVYRICDCDKFTREWLESEGIELSSPELIPLDPYTIQIKRNAQETLQKDSINNILTTRNKQPNILDGKSLKFNAILDEESDVLRKFIIHVYLIDNTIEIHEIHQKNDGYEPNRVYLHRQIVPKDSTYNIKSFVTIFATKNEQKNICYFKPEDFLLGCHVNIFNRKFLLYDCDNFTKSYYHQNFGIFDFTPIDISAKQCSKLPSKLPPIPPHVMFGKPEDTILNVKSLIPKAMAKNRIKILENQNRILRYEAIMNSSNENELCRRFLIVYRLADDFISVYERTLDGYDCLSRKFLERIRIPKPDSHPDAPNYYGPNDFYIGAHVEFFKHRFIITDADRYVLKFVEQNQDQFSRHVIESLREKICSNKS